jgi:sigma-B regulation protein RsbU (phosphoserine phosphatase)
MLMFVTVFCAIVNVRTGEMEFSNGGHNPPVLCRGGGSPAFMKPGKGVALAVMENAKFALGREKLSPGDVLFLYTDGINEAMNPAHEQFSYDRLLKGFDENKTLGMKDLILRVGDRVKTFAAGAPQSDDITMVSLRFFGPQGKGGAG